MKSSSESHAYRSTVFLWLRRLLVKALNRNGSHGLSAYAWWTAALSVGLVAAAVSLGLSTATRDTIHPIELGRLSVMPPYVGK